MIRIFRVFIPASVLALLVSEAVLIFCCYVLASFLVLDTDPGLFLLYEGGFGRIAIVVACVMLGIYFHDLYTRFRIKSRTLLLQQLCLVLGIAFLTQALLSYLKLQEWILPKWMMIVGSGLALIVMPAWRILYAKVVLKALGSERVLFVGTSSLVAEITAQITDRPELGLKPLGYLDDGAHDSFETEPADRRRAAEAPAYDAETAIALAPARTGELQYIPRLGEVRQLTAIAAELRPERIVVGMSERRNRLPVQELLDLRFSGIQIEDALAMFETVFGRVCTRELRPSQLIFTKELGPRPNRVVWQSIYSFVIALIGTAIASPIMLLVAIAVKCTSAGPVLYRQKRVGRNGSVFTVYKFRSMRANAEARTGAVWASRDDPRITPIGKWLRKLRLDEFPQLFNVLRGEMSIVGPRPERPEFVQTLAERIPYYRQRHCVKPGITGWAQINHKYGDTIEDTVTKLEFDLYYIKNLAPSLDAYIIFQTLKVMLLSRGAQ